MVARPMANNNILWRNTRRARKRDFTGNWPLMTRAIIVLRYRLLAHVELKYFGYADLPFRRLIILDD